MQDWSRPYIAKSSCRLSGLQPLTFPLSASVLVASLSCFFSFGPGFSRACVSAPLVSILMVLYVFKWLSLHDFNLRDVCFPHKSKSVLVDLFYSFTWEKLIGVNNADTIQTGKRVKFYSHRGPDNLFTTKIVLILIFLHSFYINYEKSMCQESHHLRTYWQLTVYVYLQWI